MPPVKTRVDELTLLTRAPPLLDAFIPVGKPNMGDKAAFMAHMEEMWDSRVLTNRGPKVLEFEAALCAFLGVRNFVTMCNGTVALEIAARALGLTGEVIVPSFTFIATAHCLQWQEITPVFCDVDPVTHTLDPARVEALITPRTTGIIGVHLWGQPCDTDALAEIAARRGLKLMYDAAHAMGCARGGVRVGSFGDCEVFSFHATKFFNSFEGGGVATNCDALAEDIRRRSNFGFLGYDRVGDVGTNGKMAEPCAAMGLVNLQALPRFVATNRDNYAAYRAAVGSIPGLTLFDYQEPPGTALNFQYIVVEVDEELTGLSRDELVSLLTYENVSARRYFFPGCHRMEPYKSRSPHAGLLLPVTTAVCASVFCLPTGTAISVEQIHRVGALLRMLLAHAHVIKTRLAALPFLPPIEPDQLPPMVAEAGTHASEGRAEAGGEDAALLAVRAAAHPRGGGARARVVVVGAGGHGKCVADAVEAGNAYELAGFLDAATAPGALVWGRYELLGSDWSAATLARVRAAGVTHVVIAVGDNASRARIAGELAAAPSLLLAATVVHPSAYVACGARLGEGTVVLPDAVVDVDCVVGRHCIINVRACAGHDCVLGDFAALAPGTTLSGSVRVGEGSWIGTGACVRHRISIGEHTVVGAGSAVVGDLPAAVVAYGVPARAVRTRAPADPYL